MQKGKFFFIALSLALLVTFIAMGYSFTKQRQRLTMHYQARYHLLCEVLRPGMSKDQVLSTLKQVGEFTVIGRETTGPLFEFRIVFTDPKDKELYGAFDLAFSDYKYIGAYVRKFDSSDVICAFYPSIDPAPETP